MCNAGLLTLPFSPEEIVLKALFVRRKSAFASSVTLTSFYLF